MLVLSRKKNESIIFGENIKVTIIEIRGDKVRFGIEAPIKISVHRQEIYDSIKKETKKQKTGNLEDNIEETGIKINPFKDYLKNQDYKNAYNSLINCDYKPTCEEYKELAEGLGKLLEDN